MNAMLRRRAASILAAGTLLLGGVGLMAGGVVPVPLDVLTTSHAGEAPEGHGPPEDVPRGDDGDSDRDTEADTEADTEDDTEDDAVEEGDEQADSEDGDGPDEDASETARRVHAARAEALALEDAPPCAIGMYVSSAARGEYDPEAGDEPPAVEDMPCSEDDGSSSDDSSDEVDTAGEDIGDGEDGARVGGPPAHVGARGDVDGDGSPGRSGAVGPPPGVGR